jgi:hypothetical protein
MICYWDSFTLHFFIVMCRSVEFHYRFGGTSSFRLQDSRIIQASSNPCSGEAIKQSVFPISLYTRLHGVICQKAQLFIFIGMTASNKTLRTMNYDPHFSSAGM